VNGSGPARSRLKRYVPILLILAVAFWLRAYRLVEIPPGLTHDEANHGREAIGILNGIWLLYFPLNYGSEPLYSYLVALSMRLFGEGLLALRLVNVYFGLGTVAATYAWARRALGRDVALAAAALLAVSFWPLATSRQALRAGILPLLTVAAVVFFWLLVQRAAAGKRPGWLWLGFALAVAATLYTYLAARVFWLLFPLFLLYLALFHRATFRRAWQPVATALLTAALLVAPMFIYIRLYPEVATRLQMLDRPLQAFRQGDLGPIVHNASAALLAFFWPGYGDHFLAYNIPGRPVLDGLTGVFFLAGIAVSLWRWRRPAYALLLAWFVLGITPSLVTGPEANTTRNLAALAPVYLLPAVGFTAVVTLALHRLWPAPSRLKPAVLGPAARWLLAGWLLFAAVSSGRDYFLRWAPAPDVRAAYQHTMVTALASLADEPAGPIVLSSLYPAAAHDPSLAMVLLPRHYDNLRWVDARYALLWPASQSAPLILPASTPLHPAFADFVAGGETVSLRADDLDPFFRRAQLLTAGWQVEPAPANFGDGLRLLGGRWLATPVPAGGVAELLTLWEVVEPALVGPLVPPAYTTEVVFFSHVLDERGAIVMQRDSLDAPSWSWQPGDLVAQIHSMAVPPETEPGIYQTAVGVYDRYSERRLPVKGPNGQVVETRAFVVPLEVE
jgi:4-amino-4-deoxy-L-arabinose transferase-like glycosyltransferase